MSTNIDLLLEERALRTSGILGRAGPYGNGLYAFEYALLPAEAKQVLDAVERGGPFDYPAHDGKFYGNRSADLPGLAEYREFTVKTPLVANRGKRRLVIRDNGMVFFTACHYDRVPGKPGTPEHLQALVLVDRKYRNGFYLVTGMPAAQRQRIAASMKRIHQSRLPCVLERTGRA